MEGLLILIGIWLLDVVIKKVAANRRKQQQIPPTVNRREEIEDDQESDEYGTEEAPRAPRSLQDLIRQFEEAQRQAAQGNIEPPVPPVEKRRDPNKPITLRDVAEVVIEMDVIDVEFLMDEFNMSEGDAISAINELQKHRIVGRDMGDGECDVLVHDLDELNNLLLREKRATQQDAIETAESQESMADVEALQQAQEQDAIAIELERQRKLNSLEGRAKSARESAGTDLAALAADAATNEAQPRRSPAVSTRNIADVRKGFIWAKVLDEPRFKRRWSSQYR